MRLLLLIVLTSPLIAAPVPKVPPPEAKAPNYFPCELYTKWEYECGREVIVKEVTKVRHEVECKIVTFTVSWPGTTTKMEEIYRVTKDGVWDISGGKRRIALGLMLRYPPMPNDKWVEDLPPLGKGSVVVLEPAKVEVPAGKFDVIGTSLTLRGVPAKDFQMTQFYAEGIGFVMSPAMRLGDPPLVLKKFTPPPK